MIIDFKKIPKQGKVWVFPSSRKFYSQEIAVLKERIEDFLTDWDDQENSINSSYLLKYDRFIIIAVDDITHSLSLQAHDLLIAFIQELEKIFEIVLMDKINVCYKQGEFVQYKDIKDFKKMIKTKGVSQKTIVFNNIISTKSELNQNWEINIMDSWLGHFLK
ncbi:ABC transporter ATPase [Lutibacter profundi]|uniref:ABC transporter ATPase n=1 Tax=Lutibacter profundi TaxID=1622118 RepID=A0A0X8G7Q9_9FLAO|nr:ABC transporter ATPase [Lutibacter profundi]AMC11585.1 ABC transporter ATPase [Lutibacter profundi]